MAKFIRVTTWGAEDGNGRVRAIDTSLIAQMIDDNGNSPRATRIYLKGNVLEYGFTKNHFDCTETLDEILSQL